METLSEYPDQFLHHRGQGQVAATLAHDFPNFTLDQLRLEPKEGRLMYPTPPHDKLDLLHPPYLAVHFHDILKLSAQMVLLDAWDTLHSLDVVYPKPEPQCSQKSPALHLGIWETYRLSPIITAESQNQAPKVILAMDLFLTLIGQLIAPKLQNFLKNYFPRQYFHQQRCVLKSPIMIQIIDE